MYLHAGLTKYVGYSTRIGVAAVVKVCSSAGSIIVVCAEASVVATKVRGGYERCYLASLTETSVIVHCLELKLEKSPTASTSRNLVLSPGLLSMVTLHLRSD